MISYGEGDMAWYATFGVKVLDVIIGCVRNRPVHTNEYEGILFELRRLVDRCIDESSEVLEAERHGFL